MIEPIDILFCSFNRRAFTEKSFETMAANTDWSKVARLVIYDDGSVDGTAEYLMYADYSVTKVFRQTHGLGPVGIMRDFLQCGGSEVFAKIDSDTMLPPGWLNECLDLMERQPEIDLLGIEARIDAEPAGPPPRTTYPAQFIGGIGLMRRRCFTELPEPAARMLFGFTEWQQKHPEVVKAWIQPPLPVCLLNLVPFNPWRSLSQLYIKQEIQRSWPEPYSPERKELWEWWHKEV